MKEYAVYKGRGDSWVELYRGDSKDDATSYFLEKCARYGNPDRYTETLASKVMTWNQENAAPLWLSLSEENKNA